MNSKEKVVLAYSGGLDTSIIIPWLKENYDLEVIACCVDVGQGEGETDGVYDKAIMSGAANAYVLDVKKEFVEEYVFKMLKAGAIYEDKYLLGTAIARPLIGKKLVEIADKEGAKYIVHGCTGKGNDQVRFELAIKALNPEIKIIAPWREWTIKSREEAIEYAEARNIPIPVKKKSAYSMDRNLWHLSHEGEDLEFPWNEHQSAMYKMTVTPEAAPDQATYVEIDFEKGIPVAVDGVKMDGVALLVKLNGLAGANGVGIADMVENRLVGMKSRGVYETPGGTVLYTAHRELERLTLDRNTSFFKASVSDKYAQMVYDGLWFTPLREALDAFVDSTQETVTGTVKVKLYKGNCTLAASKSPYSLYSEELATFGADEVYNQKDSEGFINLFGLPLKVRALLNKKLTVNGLHIDPLDKKDLWIK